MKRILFLSVIFTLLFLGCKRNELIQPLTAAQLQAFNYLPSQSDFVEYLNLNELRKTEFWDSYFKSLLINENNSEWVEEFKKGTGVSFGDGISQILITSGKNIKNTGVVFFDKNFKKIKTYFEESDSFKKETIENKPVYLLRKSLQFYFVNDSTLLVSSDKNYLSSFLKEKLNL